jgi:hypothetical protein
MIKLGISNLMPGKDSLDALTFSPTVQRVLLEVSTWCSLTLALDKELRSSQLDPSHNLEVPPFDSLGVAAWTNVKRESYRRSTCAINKTRSLLLRDAKIAVTDFRHAQSKGKLLLYEPLETVSDGAAEAASRGFFDVEDAPPWDTWFLYSNGAIYSWVPNSMIPFAQAGIDANPVDCIHWVNWSILPSEINC